MMSLPVIDSPSPPGQHLTPPPGQHLTPPPLADSTSPPRQHLLPRQHPPRTAPSPVNKWAVCILLECFLVTNDFNYRISHKKYNSSLQRSTIVTEFPLIKIVYSNCSNKYTITFVFQVIAYESERFIWGGRVFCPEYIVIFQLFL